MFLQYRAEYTKRASQKERLGDYLGSEDSRLAKTYMRYGLVLPQQPQQHQVEGLYEKGEGKYD